MRINLSTPSATHLWILVAVSAFAWSFGPICVRFAFQYDMRPALVSFGRMITGVVMFAPYIWYRGAREIAAMPARSRWLALIAGAMSGINIVLMVASLEHISVLINQAFIATIPIWVAFFEVTLLKQKLGAAVWLGILAALAGGLTIALSTTEGPAVLPGGNPGLGIMMAVVSACSASLYIIIGRKVRGEVSFVPYIWLVYAAGALVTLAIIAADGVSLIGYDPRGYLWVLLLAILAQILGHGALNFVLRFMSPTTLTMTVQSAPILSAIWAYLIFSEIPTIPQAIGSVILVIGVTIVLRGQQVRRQPD
ncbi:MAG: DMT family transporter [Chloroflexota bacterium]|nr:DMT family transporter [Chloroflexota bacterium]MDE2908048.1 DMT family transporter [Chloroflexota bacterium]